MEAQSKVQETERILQLLEDESMKLKEKVDVKANGLSGFVEGLQARNKDVMTVIEDLEALVESLSDENRRLKEQAENESKTITKMQTKEAELESLVQNLQKAVRGKEDQLLDVEQRETDKSAPIQKLAVEFNHLQQELGEKCNDELKTLNKKKEGLQEKLQEQENMLTQMEDLVSELNRKLILQENESYTRIDLLEKQTSTIKQEFAAERESLLEKLALMENQNGELNNKISDMQMTLKRQEKTITRLQADCDLAKGRLQQAADRKMDNMAKEFRKNFEADLKILGRRIQVAEQVQYESKETCRRIKERCEKEHGRLGKKAPANEMPQTRKTTPANEMLQTRKTAPANEMLQTRKTARSRTNINAAANKEEMKKLNDSANEMLNGMEALCTGFGDKEGELMRRVSNIKYEIAIMKNWVGIKTNEKAEMEKLHEVETKLNEEKLKDLQKRIEELEKIVAEKEEGFSKLVEEKKEVIRQMSVYVEYQQGRCDQLKEALTSVKCKGKGKA